MSASPLSAISCYQLRARVAVGFSITMSAVLFAAAAGHVCDSSHRRAASAVAIRRTAAHVDGART